MATRGPEKVIALYTPYSVDGKIDGYMYRWYHGLASRDGAEYPMCEFAYSGSGSPMPLDFVVNTAILPRVCEPGENMILRADILPDLDQFDLDLRQVVLERGFSQPFTIGDFGHRQSDYVESLNDLVLEASLPIHQLISLDEVEYFEVLRSFSPDVEKQALKPGRAQAFPIKMANDYRGPQEYRVEAVFDLDQLSRYHILGGGQGFFISSRFAEALSPFLDEHFWQLTECDWIPVS